MLIPGSIAEYLGHDEGKVLPLIQCKKCCVVAGVSIGGIEVKGCREFIALNCTNPYCKVGTWFVCCCCFQSFARIGRAEVHTSTTTHLNNHRKLQESATRAQCQDPPRDNQAALVPLIELTNDAQSMLSTDSSEVSTTETNTETTTASGDDSSDDVDAPFNVNAEENRPDTTFAMDSGRPLDSRHDWLATALKNDPIATDDEVIQSLKCSPNMQRFWAAEHAVPGGGLKYLVARAFYRTTFLHSYMMPSTKEAEWQCLNFMQYVSLSRQQAERQAEIISRITSSGSDLIQKTRIPNAQELKQFYKSDSQHSFWSSLPVPKIQNIGGIAYVNPEDIVRHAYACGLFFDDIIVTKDTDTSPSDKKQHYVSDSKCVQEMAKKVQDSQPENGDYSIVVSWCTDWRDGFTPNHSKQNRASVVCWTFTVSPAKEFVNDKRNTFCMAVGAKGNSSWSQIEHQVRKDTACFGNPNVPLRCYHGRLKKMVDVYVQRITSIHDRPERAEVTGTLAYSGNHHRIYGTLFHIESPTYDPKKIQNRLEQARPFPPNDSQNALEWGWTDGMLDDTDPHNRFANGSTLPSCVLCRAKGLHALLGAFPRAADDLTDEDIEENHGICPRCANWTIDKTTAPNLLFKAPPKYPTTSDPTCPLDPPRGRCTTAASLNFQQCPITGKTVNYLTTQELEFANCIAGSRFAFYHLTTRNKDCRWKDGPAAAYMISLGISPKIIKKLIEVAKDVTEQGRQDQVNYYDPEGIDAFRFPSSWIDTSLKASHYIETVMHQLFLGIARDNFKLCARWNKLGNRDTAFKRNAQELQRAIKKFGLSWLTGTPFTNSDDPKAAKKEEKSSARGTGSWCGEDWVGWTRTSRIAYLHVCSPANKTTAHTTGNGDVLRLVVSFACVAARAMTHSGVDKKTNCEFSLHLKEFFNCIRELDVQVRYKEMKKKKKSEESEDFLEEEELILAQAERELLKELQGIVPEEPGDVLSEPVLFDGNSARNNASNDGNVVTVNSQANRKRAATTSNKTTITVTRKKKKKDEEDDDEDYVPPPPKRSLGKKTSTKRQSSKKKPTKKKQATKKKQPTKKKKSTKTSKSSKDGGEDEGGGGKGNAWWTKANYMSLPNLLAMIEFYGQLVNLWDGGGKGEKFIQAIKPFITRGVHEYPNFFPLIMDKLYKHGLFDLFIEMYDIFPGKKIEGSPFAFDPQRDIEDVIFELAGDAAHEVDSTEVPSDPTPIDIPVDYSPMEDANMSKSKTYFVYRSRASVNSSINDKLPLSGVLIPSQEDSEKLDFFLLYWEKRRVCWLRVTFHDKEGVCRVGLWYAPVEVSEPNVNLPDNQVEVKSLAKMAAVAIPMHYGVGKDHVDAEKFCVITNWWKDRNMHGRYVLPVLDFGLYVRHDNYDSILQQFGGGNTPNVI